MAPLSKGSCGSKGEVPKVSQLFPFLQIPESLNSAIRCKFHFLKLYLLPKIVIRDEQGIKISRKGEPSSLLLLSLKHW